MGSNSNKPARGSQLREAVLLEAAAAAVHTKLDRGEVRGSGVGVASIAVEHKEG